MRRAALLFLAAVGCSGPSTYERLVPDPSHTTNQIQAACRLTAVRCTQCHPIERVFTTARLDAPRWESLVKRMRLKPSSGISEPEAKQITSCLAFRDAARKDAATPPPGDGSGSAQPETVK